MKTILTLLLLSACAAFGQLRTNVVLEHDYDVKKLTNVWFFYYWSPTLTNPVTSWAVLGVNPGTTNAPTKTNITLAIMPGEHYFAARASNYWGLNTNFSNVVLPPAPPESDFTLRLR